MKLLTSLKKRENLPLYIILLVACVLRFYKLGFESFWCDELHVMNEADPAVSFHQLVSYLIHSDFQPPLYFLIQKGVFILFGRSEVTGRLWSAIAGVAAVWAMYKLGKEVLNRNLGLIAASLTCINYFAVYYARENRPYSQLFLVATLSLVYFIRLLKTNSRRDMLLYALFATLTMYTHYFGTFLVTSQFCVAFILYFFAADRKLYLKRFVVAWLIIAAVYMLWVPTMLQVNAMPTSWISSVSENFVFEYFNAYFGNSEFLKPILVVMLLVYLINVFSNGQPKLMAPVSSPLTLSFIVFSVCLVISYALPYLRSVLVLPILWDRYTIIVLPIYLAAAAYGTILIREGWARSIVLTVFLGWSVLFLLLINHMYTWPHKSQFREMTAFMAADSTEKDFPTVNDRLMWQEHYYLQKYGMKGAEMADIPRNATVDSIVHATSGKYALKSFWLWDAHGAGDPNNFLEPGVQAALNKDFVIEREGHWLDSWARLYVSKSIIPGQLTPEDFPGQSVVDMGGKVVAIWGGFITSIPIALPQGDYTMHILGRATSAKHVYPHVIVSVNGKAVGDYFAVENFKDVQLPYHHADSDSVRVTIGYDNDYFVAYTKSDRNLYVQKIDFVKKQ
jgi:hypothetical protein